MATGGAKHHLFLINPYLPYKMKIKQLKKYIQKLENDHGNIDDVTINFRWGHDSDIHLCNFIEEDLYKEDNKTLDTICFLTDNEES